MKFRKPPLVECVVELRWAPSAPEGMSLGGGPLTSLSALEEFYMRFGARAGELSFNQIERLQPAGFPVLPHQPVYRFRSSAPEKRSCLYQLGPGLFSANITPPYKTWADFAPIVRAGIEILAHARGPTEREQPYQACFLRYIDAFRKDLVNGRSVASFLRESLGFAVEVPQAIRDQMPGTAEAEPKIQLTVPLRDNQTMTIMVAGGMIEGESCVVMDTAVATPVPVGPGVDEVMVALDSAHQKIHDVFIGMTATIHRAMEPEGAEA